MAQGEGGWPARANGDQYQVAGVVHGDMSNCTKAVQLLVQIIDKIAGECAGLGEHC
ncbi:hypothetical protein D3C84_1194870 [compost metagenome]